MEFRVAVLNAFPVSKYLRIVLVYFTIMMGTATTAIGEVHFDIPRADTEFYNYTFSFCVLNGDEVALEVYLIKQSSSYTKQELISAFKSSNAPVHVVNSYLKATKLLYDEGFTIQEASDRMFATCMEKVQDM